MQPEILHRLAADQVLLDDPFEHVLGAGMVPDPVRPDERDRPGGADLQAIGLAPLDPAASFAPRSRQSQLFETLFQVFPGSLALLPAAALLLFRKRAEENVALDCCPANRAERTLCLGKVGGGGCRRGWRQGQRRLPAMRVISALT